jgi:hypothetical protein
MQYTRHERARGMFWSLGLMLAALVLWQCGTGGGAADAGTLSMNLVAHVNGSTYRLRDAVFAVSGPESLELSTEGSPDDIDDGETTSDGSCGGAACGDALTASLLVGDYQILLREGWRLERDSGAGFEDVASRLASTNPARFVISGGTTTSVVFAFEADGRVIPFDRGTLEVTITVEERDGVPVFDPAACDFENLQGCEALTCQAACATNDGGFCSSVCAEVMECVASGVDDGSCSPTEADPMCAVRSQGVPNTCTIIVETGGGTNPSRPGLPSSVARELVRCLCSTPRP